MSKPLPHELKLYVEWTLGCDQMPKPGQKVIEYYLGADGNPVGPIAATPIHVENTHLIANGKSCYRETLWWMPAPDIAEIQKTWKARKRQE